MRLSFRSLDISRWFRGAAAGRDPRAAWRIILAALGLANLVALVMVIRPPGGSAQQLDRELASLRTQIHRQQAAVQTLQALVKKVETARAQQESFMSTHFMDLTSASSTITSEILAIATKSGLKQKEHSFETEPIDGSANLSMMTISASYEGTYADLIEFVNLVDRSDRFLIIDNIAAAPQQGSGTLNVRFKINAFVREAAPGAPSPPRTTTKSETVATLREDPR